MVRTAFPDIRFTQDEVIAFDDMVAVSGLFRGTHNGPLYGIEASGRYCEMRGMVMWRVTDGALRGAVGRAGLRHPLGHHSRRSLVAVGDLGALRSFRPSIATNPGPTNKDRYP